MVCMRKKSEICMSKYFEFVFTHCHHTHLSLEVVMMMVVMMKLIVTSVDR